MRASAMTQKPSRVLACTFYNSNKKKPQSSRPSWNRQQQHQRNAGWVYVITRPFSGMFYSLPTRKDKHAFNRSVVAFEDRHEALQFARTLDQSQKESQGGSNIGSGYIERVLQAPHELKEVHEGTMRKRCNLNSLGVVVLDRPAHLPEVPLSSNPFLGASSAADSTTVRSNNIMMTTKELRDNLEFTYAYFDTCHDS